MADRMTYEMLIRRAHSCRRFGVAGANADTYDHFLLDLLRYNEARKRKESTEDLAFQMGITQGRLIAYIETAISVAMRRHNEQLNNAQQRTLQECRDRLSGADATAIDEIIDIAERIMHEAGIAPG